MRRWIPFEVNTGPVSGRERRSVALLPSLIPFGLLGGEVNGQCVPVKGVRSDLVASDWPGSVLLNRWWPGVLRRQPSSVGSHSGYCMSWCLWLGRSQMVFYRDPGRPCIVLLRRRIERPSADPCSTGRESITVRKAEPMRCKESDGPIVVMTPWETREEAPLSDMGLGGEPKASHLRRGPSLVGAGTGWHWVGHRPMSRRCRVLLTRLLANRLALSKTPTLGRRIRLGHVHTLFVRLSRRGQICFGRRCRA